MILAEKSLDQKVFFNSVVVTNLHYINNLENGWGKPKRIRFIVFPAPVVF